MAQFSRKEAEFIVDVLDSWEDGVKVAKQETTVDPTVESAEELVSLSSSYDEQLAMCQRIKEKVGYDSYTD